MTIQVGDHLPQVTFRVSGADGPEAKTTDDLFKGRRVVLVGAAQPAQIHERRPHVLSPVEEIGEQAAGEPHGRERIKIVEWDEMVKHAGPQA